MESSECVSDFELPLEIIIGTIPLHHVMRQHPPPPARCESLPKAGYDFNRFQEPPQGATAPFLDMEDSAISLKPIMPVVPYSDFPELREWEFFMCLDASYTMLPIQKRRKEKEKRLKMKI